MPVAVETVPAAAAATPARRKLDTTPFTPNTPQDSPRKRNAKKNKKQRVEVEDDAIKNANEEESGEEEEQAGDEEHMLLRAIRDIESSEFDDDEEEQEKDGEEDSGKGKGKAKGVEERSVRAARQCPILYTGQAIGKRPSRLDRLGAGTVRGARCCMHELFLEVRSGFEQ